MVLAELVSVDLWHQLKMVGTEAVKPGIPVVKVSHLTEST
jgi:hypothetical protein